MVGLLHAMAFVVLQLICWVIWNNKPLPLQTDNPQHKNNCDCTFGQLHSFFCCYEFNVICCVITSHGLRAFANNSGRNVDLNKIRFSCLHILHHCFWIVFESEKRASLYWYLEKSQSNSMRPTVIITICKCLMKPR